MVYEDHISDLTCLELSTVIHIEHTLNFRAKWFGRVDGWGRNVTGQIQREFCNEMESNGLYNCDPSIWACTCMYV